MTEQGNAAAERSAHVSRGGRKAPDAYPTPRCYVCGAEFKGGASYAARVLPPMVEVCSPTCAADDLFTGSGIRSPWELF